MKKSPEHPPKNSISDSVCRILPIARDWCSHHALGIDTVAACAAAGFEAASFAATGTDTKLTAGQAFVDALSYGQFWGILLLVFAVLLFAGVLTRRRLIPCAALTLLTVLFAAKLSIIIGSNIWFNLGLVLILLIVARYVSKEDKLCLDKLRFSYDTGRVMVAVGFLVFTVVISWATMLKYKTFSESTFDLGIFAQMFEQMARTGLPMTSIERSTYLSHFAVHFSPVYYLFLPGYLLIRHPLYLFAIQALFVGLGGFAVYGIARKLELTPMNATACAFLYFLYPSMSSGCFYDFHENKFLAVFLLFLVYFLLEAPEKRKSFGGVPGEKSDTAVAKGSAVSAVSADGFSPRRVADAWLRFLPACGFAFLTLSVKEDAVIYIAAVALWVVLTRKSKWRGVFLLVLSVAYYLFAVSMITKLGGTLLVDRYRDFIPTGEESMLDVAKLCIYNIGYFLSKVFVEEKMAYVLWMLVPVLFAPFLCKKQGTLVLLIPMLAVNLMSSWKYQYDVDYQYTYGVGALILVCLVLAVAGMPHAKRKSFLLAALMISFVLTASLTFPKIGRYSERYYGNPAYYTEVDAFLEENIPSDASVTANGFIVPHLYYVDDLNAVPDNFGKPHQTDYYVVDTRYQSNDRYKMDKYMKNDYEMIGKCSFVEIWKLKEKN